MYIVCKCLYNVCTRYIHSLNMYIHKHISMQYLLAELPSNCLQTCLYSTSYNMNLYIQCMYLVYTSYEQALNKYVHKHVCNVITYMFVQSMYNLYTCLYLVHPSSSCLIPGTCNFFLCPKHFLDECHSYAPVHLL
jgi:hypothetical protein